MSKKSLPPTPLLIPLPAVLVSCGQFGQSQNIITIAWCGVVCSEPPMLSISVRESRHSFEMIRSSGEFVLNVVGADLVRAVDYCGSHSGRKVDKFAEAGLTPLAAAKVKSPLIKEAPINLECQVRKSIELGSHHMFIAEIVATHVDQEYLDAENKLRVADLDPIAYCPNVREYWSGLNKLHGNYGQVWNK